MAFLPTPLPGRAAVAPFRVTAHPAATGGPPRRRVTAVTPGGAGEAAARPPAAAAATAAAAAAAVAAAAPTAAVPSTTAAATAATATAAAAATAVRRRQLLGVVAAAALGVAAAAAPPPSVAAAAAVVVEKPKALDEPLTALVQCRAALPPIRGYLNAGKWDKARTNVNYCTRVLRLATNIRLYASALGGDSYYDALDVLSDVMNLTTQLDASAYTAGFIPADEGEIPTEAQKYLDQGLAFLDQVEGLMDQLLALSGGNVERVKAKAKNVPLPILTEW